jgi:diguanylate cyclase (GGDEF)-like protein
MNLYISKRSLSPVIFMIIGITIQFLFVFNMEKGDALQEVDETLLRAAKNIKYFLGRDYVNSELDSSTYSPEEALGIFSKLQYKAEEEGVDYLYLLVRKNEDIHYAAVSDYEEELLKDPNSFYWLSLKEAGDDSFSETWSAFDSEEAIYLKSSDMWDTYRSIYIPETAPDGTKYLAGADITTTNLKKILLVKTAKIILNFWIFILTSLPLILSFSKLQKERRFYAKQMAELADLDPLTGVFNRSRGITYLKSELKTCLSGEIPLSICLVDIQNLGYINKKLGLHIGDEILRIVALLLKYTFRKTDKIVRIEGDKFMAILPGCDEKSRDILAATLLKRVAFFNKHNLKDYFIKLHYLFAEYSEGSEEDFVEEALSHLILQKKSGNTYDTVIQDEMLDSLKKNEFKVFFQPKVYLKSKKVEFEALARWLHPQKGIIPPDSFIPLAEGSFLINRITEVVLKDSLEAAGRLNTNISVNISPVVFENHNFVRDMERILLNSPFSDRIIFEITEGIAIKDMASTLKKIKDLKRCGIKFSIDDFGTGYSSLSYLEKFPISELKIDKSFIKNINKHRVNRLIISFICQVGELMDFNVIAEGTEEAWQIHDLLSLGCHNFQGYYFDRPQPLETIIENRKEYLEKMKEFS